MNIIAQKALDTLDSRGSLRSSSLAPLVAVVLTSPGVAERVSPFHSARQL